MQKEIKFIDVVSLSYLIALLTVVIFFSLIQDYLFFKSDIAVLLNFFLASGAVLFLFFLFPLLPLFYFRGNLFRRYSQHILSSIIFGQILFGFAIHLLDQFFLATESVSTFLLICLVLFFVISIIALLLCRNTEISRKITNFSKAGFFLSFGILFYFSVTAKLMSQTFPENLPNRNVIIIVLDGLSTKYLNPYNPEEDTPFFQELASKSMLYTNMRSNFTYTSGFFYSLYSGRKNWVEHSSEATKGLLSILQDAGVNTRWFTFHNNGVPDSHNFPFDFPYKGLRGKALTGQLTWYPKFLGIDYNIFGLHGTRDRGKKMGYREDALNTLLHKIAGDSYLLPLETGFIDEVQSLRKDPRPFFAVIHLPPNALSLYDNDPKLWEFSEKDFVPPDLLSKAKKKMVKEYLTYSEEDSWAVKIMEQNYRKQIMWGTKSLLNFYKTFIEKGWDQDTLLIITADHGKIFARKKIEYTFHPDEEVARVPFLLLWKGRKGIDDRMAETIDITQTILDFYQIQHRFFDSALSLLSNTRKTNTTTLTDWAPLKNEYFLNVYNQNDKYIFNISPGHFKVRKENFTGYFETVPTNDWKTLPNDLGFDFMEILRDYGFPGDPVTAENILDLVSP